MQRTEKTGKMEEAELNSEKSLAQLSYTEVSSLLGLRFAMISKQIEKIRTAQTTSSAQKCIEALLQMKDFFLYIQLEYCYLKKLNYWQLLLQYGIEAHDLPGKKHPDVLDTYFDISEKLEDIFRNALTQFLNESKNRQIPYSFCYFDVYFTQLFSKLYSASKEKVQEKFDAVCADFVNDLMTNLYVREYAQLTIPWTELEKNEHVSPEVLFTMYSHKLWFMSIRTRIEKIVYNEIVVLQTCSNELLLEFTDPISQFLMPLASMAYGPVQLSPQRFGSENKAERMISRELARLSQLFTAHLIYALYMRKEFHASTRQLQASAYWNEYQETISLDFEWLDSLLQIETNQSVLESFSKLDLTAAKSTASVTLVRLITICEEHLAYMQHLLGNRDPEAESLFTKYFGLGGMIQSVAQARLAQFKRTQSPLQN